MLGLELVEQRISGSCSSCGKPSAVTGAAEATISVTARMSFFIGVPQALGVG